MGHFPSARSGWTGRCVLPRAVVWRWYLCVSAGTGNRGSGRWALREELGTATLRRSRLTSERVLRRRDSGCAWRLDPGPGLVSPLERGAGCSRGWGSRLATRQLESGLLSDPWSAGGGVASGGLAEDRDLGRITVVADHPPKAEVLSSLVKSPRGGRGCGRVEWLRRVESGCEPFPKFLKLVNNW